MVWNLLKKNISVWQIAGYAIANLTGLAIVLAAICFYCDVRSAFDDNDSIVGSDYLIISRPVPLLSVMSAGSQKATTFGEDEIAELRSQPWAGKVGVFQSAAFDVWAYVELGGRRMSTALFFEAIPDEFYDITPENWSFDPSDPIVPIVISKDYLTLYNFGFAASRGYPQLSEDLIKKVPVTVGISGNGRSSRFPARIVGFSSRLNTIAVPQEFLDWANGIYGEADRMSESPSRLIVEVNKPGDPAIEEYFNLHGIEAGGDKAGSSRAIFLTTLITTIVLAVGVIITLLAVFILMLSIYLLIQKSRDKLRDLMLLGYSPSQICRYYFRLVGFVNLGILLLAAAIAAAVSGAWRPALESLGLSGGTLWPSFIAGVVLMALITVFNFITIRRLVTKAAKN
ncbi:MAG: ABC transporter permease [Muribaculaceae bacterium]|nr:ABC transporter permease [Muribaculaceae bacterium]